MPDPFDLPMDFESVLPPATTATPPQPQAPPLVRADPKQQLLQIAALGAMLGAGPRSGFGTGFGHGVINAEGAMQHLADQHAEIVRRQQEDIRQAQRQQAIETEARQRSLQNALATISQRVMTLPTKEAYDAEIEGHANQLRAMGYRLDANWLRRAVPYVAPAAAKRAGEILDGFLKNPANLQMMREHPSEIAKAVVQFDRDGDGIKEDTPILLLSQIAQRPFAVDESGNMLDYGKGKSLDDAVSADGYFKSLKDQAKAEGKDVTDPAVLNDLRQKAQALANGQKNTGRTVKVPGPGGKPIEKLFTDEELKAGVPTYEPPKEAKATRKKVTYRDPVTGKSITGFFTDEELAGKTFENATPAGLETRLASASAVVKTGNEITKMLSDPAVAAKFGPALSRYNSLADFVGHPPPEFAKLAGMIESYSLANMGVHGMRSAGGADAISKTIGLGRHDAKSIIQVIDGLNGFAKTLLADEGRDPQDVQTPIDPLASARDKLRKRNGTSR